MTDTNGFARLAEVELCRTGITSHSTCEAWQNLAPGGRNAFAKAMFFLGCPNVAASSYSPIATEEADRIAAARLMLLKLGLHSREPVWSSTSLQHLLEAVLSIPGGSLGDLFHALYEVLGDFSTPLSHAVVNFIKDVVVNSFTRYRPAYDSVNWAWFVERTHDGAAEAQLYLALHAIPPQHVPPWLTNLIAKGLESTPYCEEARTILAS
jgi:hypothetical protein